MPTKQATAISTSTSAPLINELYLIEHVGRQLHARCGETIAALRTDARRLEPAAHLAVLAKTETLEQEDVLHGDDAALHAGELGDAGDLSRAVGEARNLHDQVDGRGNLLADRLFRNIQVRHGDHRVEA